MLRIDQRGIALVKVLFLTSILLAVAAYAARGTRVEVRIAQNDYLAKRALHIAEAGLDRAWRKVETDLAGGASLTSELGNSTGFLGVGSDYTAGDGTVYREVSFGGGNYRVRLLNNSDEAGTPTTDVDGKILISSTGLLSGSQRQLESLLLQSGAFDHGLFAKYGLRYSGTGSGNQVATDSYNSGLGTPYSQQTPGSQGNVGSNGDIDGNGGATIMGDAAAGGSVSAGNMTVTGDTTTGAPQLALPPVTPCNTNGGSYSSTVGIEGGSGNSIRANGNIPNNTVYLPPQGSSPGIYTYCFDNVDLSNKTLEITQPVILKVTGYVDISGGGIINSATPSGGPPLPANFQIYSSCVGSCGGGSAGIKLTGGSTAAYVVYAPEADIQYNSNAGNVFGAVIGGNISMGGGVNFHYDEALAGLGPKVTALVSWHEVRN